jgi:hypothetical protein
MLYALACLGILITTGGCAESATAPEAASIEASASRSKKTAPTEDSSGGTEDTYTVSGGLLNGGGRAAEAP